MGLAENALVAAPFERFAGGSQQLSGDALAAATPSDQKAGHERRAFGIARQPSQHREAFKGCRVAPAHHPVALVGEKTLCTTLPNQGHHRLPVRLRRPATPRAIARIVVVEMAVAAPPFVVLGEGDVVEEVEEIRQPFAAQGVELR